MQAWQAGNHALSLQITQANRPAIFNLAIKACRIESSAGLKGKKSWTKPADLTNQQAYQLQSFFQGLQD